MNSQAFYSHGSVEAQLAFLDRCDYLQIYRQAAKDWYKNNRVWRPITEDECDYALNAVPPITMRRGFIAGEPYCHTLEGKPVYRRWHLAKCLRPHRLQIVRSKSGTSGLDSK